MKFCGILHLTVAVLFLSQIAHAKYITESEDFLDLLKNDDSVSSIGRPSTSTSSESRGGCKKDILILLDTSRTIGAKDFNNQVKPFLRDFVSDKTLDVGPEGAQVSLLLFSKWDDPNSRYYRKDDDKTKVVISFDQDFTPQMFERFINNTNYKDVEGGHTRTDKALEIANDKVFPEESPLNNRKFANDVIVLITDGRPQGTNTVEQDAIDNAEKLKKKGVLIIGVGVGRQIENDEFWKILKEIASPGQAFKVKFDEFQSIKSALVQKSCQKYPSAPAGIQCDCPPIVASPFYLKPGETSISLSWKRPDPECPSGTVKVLDFTWSPTLRSPAKFGPGHHSINYKFYLSGNQEMNCSVVFNVKECKCPPQDVHAVQVKPGDSMVNHEWPVPVPSCLGCPSPLTSQSLSVGQHSMAYKYSVADQFNITCRVNINVTGVLCSGQGYDKNSQECCCGVIHDKKTGYECCGQNYYDTSTHQCCEGENIRKIRENCPTVKN